MPPPGAGDAMLWRLAGVLKTIAKSANQVERQRIERTAGSLVQEVLPVEIGRFLEKCDNLAKVVRYGVSFGATSGPGTSGRNHPGCERPLVCWRMMASASIHNSAPSK